MTGAWLAAAALLGCGSPLGGLCDHSASAGGAFRVLVKDAAGADGVHLRPGDYTFTVTTELGAVEWSCRVTARGPGEEACDRSELLTSEDGERTALISAIAPDEGFQLVFELYDGDVVTGPKEIDVVVVRDGEVAGEGHYAPEYTVARGTGVGAGCPAYLASADSPTLAL
jgi:hypothetical protein